MTTELTKNERILARAIDLLHEQLKERDARIAELEAFKSNIIAEYHFIDSEDGLFCWYCEAIGEWLPCDEHNEEIVVEHREGCPFSEHPIERISVGAWRKRRARIAELEERWAEMPLDDIDTNLLILDMLTGEENKPPGLKNARSWLDANRPEST